MTERPILRRLTIQDVIETPVEPRLAFSVVPPRADRFIQDMSVTATQSADFLIEPVSRLVDQILITAIPQFALLKKTKST